LVVVVVMSRGGTQGIFNEELGIHTFLKYLGAIDFDQAKVGIFIFLAVTHSGGETALLRPEKVGRCRASLVQVVFFTLFGGSRDSRTGCTNNGPTYNIPPTSLD
jgi:hypothetical protein